MVAIIEATKTYEGGAVDIIDIYYFDSEESFSLVKEELLATLERWKDITEYVTVSDVIVMYNENMIWIATVQGLVDAQ